MGRLFESKVLDIITDNNYKMPKKCYQTSWPFCFWWKLVIASAVPVILLRASLWQQFCAKRRKKKTSQATFYLDFTVIIWNLSAQTTLVGWDAGGMKGFQSASSVKHNSASFHSGLGRKRSTSLWSQSFAVFWTGSTPGCNAEEYTRSVG